jgi:hypothetical protein
MGAIGPNYFTELINGGVAVYDRSTGQRVSQATTSESFFAVTVPSGPFAGTYPTGFAEDPRLVYDQQSQRWIACALDTGSQQVLLAVSHGPNPVGNGGSTWVSDNWTKYFVPIAPGHGTDFDRLGVDDNGIYITISVTSPNLTTMLAALPKAPFLNGSAQTVQSSFIFDTGFPPYTYIYPAVNLDAVTTADPVWFIGENAQTLYYNRLQWVNGLGAPPVFQLSSWGTIPISPSYLELPSGLYAPQKGPPNAEMVDPRTGSALLMATVRKIGGTQYLWTAHTIGVNSAGNNSGPPADRMGVEWFQIQTTPTFQITSTSRIFDNAATNPRFYYLPSLAVNTNGDMVLGFSGSSVNDYIGAFYTRRSGTGAWMPAPIPYLAGQQYTSIGIWGDYSHTSVDPDGLRIWTIQEYAVAGAGEYWGTQAAAIKPFAGGP